MEPVVIHNQLNKDTYILDIPLPHPPPQDYIKIYDVVDEWFNDEIDDIEEMEYKGGCSI